MQLELKYLAPYLPYGFKFVSSMDKPFDECGKQPIWTFNGISEMFGDYCLLTKENNDAYSIVSCKPILRPLSDLTKEIEHNGEKLIMFDRIEIYKYSGVDYLIEQIRIGFVEVIIYNMLIEYHFDVFGLIEQGLAIDINTLNK